MHRAARAATTVAVTASTLVAAGCKTGGETGVQALARTTATVTAPSDLPTLKATTLLEPPASAVETATAWARVACGWTPTGAADVMTLMTAAAASRWLASRAAPADTTTATCADITVAPLEGPATDSTTYVLVTADRTVVGSDGSVTSSEFIEPRRIVEQDGHWLVDVRVEGG